MEDIIESYGSGLLQILGGLCAMTVWLQLFAPNGMLRQFFMMYLMGICG